MPLVTSCNVRIGSDADEIRCPRHVRFTLDSDNIADITQGRRRTMKIHRGIYTRPMPIKNRTIEKERAMKAAIVLQAGRPPVYDDVKEPVLSIGESRIAVTAAALSPVVKARASGTHYSSSGGFPIGVGIDGVGRLDDGSRVHFLLPRAPY